MSTDILHEISEMKFPILSIIDNDVRVYQTSEEYSRCVCGYVDTLNKIEEQIVDDNGALFERGEVKKLKVIKSTYNFFIWNKSRKLCYVHKEVTELKELDLDELKEKFVNLVSQNSHKLENANYSITILRKSIEESESKRSLLTQVLDIYW